MVYLAVAIRVSDPLVSRTVALSPHIIELTIGHLSAHVECGLQNRLES